MNTSAMHRFASPRLLFCVAVLVTIYALLAQILDWNNGGVLHPGPLMGMAGLSLIMLLGAVQMPRAAVRHVLSAAGLALILAGLWLGADFVLN
jgi:hypothetical protein